MTQLCQTVVRDLEADKAFLLTMVSLTGKVTSTVTLREEPGEVLITLLVGDKEIEQAVREAVEEVFGKEYTVSDVYTSCGKRMIHFELSKY